MNLTRLPVLSVADLSVPCLPEAVVCPEFPDGTATFGDRQSSEAGVGMPGP